MDKKKAIRMIETFILALFSVFMFQLLISGNITRYMNPRNTPWIYFAAITLAILAFANMIYNMLFERTSDKLWKQKFKISPFIIFLIPMVAALSMNSLRIDASIMANKGISLSKKTTVETLRVTKGSSKLTEEDLLAKLGDIEDVTDSGDILMVNSELFNHQFLTLDETDNSLIDKGVQIVGFIYNDKSFDANTFMVARYAMVCCNVDMQVTGYLADLPEGIDPLTNGTWVHARGTFDLTTYKDTPVIMIHIDSYDEIPEPLDPLNAYIYPY